MPLFLITGTAGTGKTEVCNLLKKNGYSAYDADDDGLAHWQHNETCYIHPKSTVGALQRTADFLKEHSWNVPRQYIEDLSEKAKDKPIFLSGSLGNEEELRDLFAKVFVLYVDDNTLKQRLATRTNNDWGKQPHELQQTLRHHHEVYDTHREHGDVIINADKPPAEIVEEILASLN